ncbi:MAG: hypothetical protein A2508_06390 [Candidatus Lambdaproteobacteria bacterium RIFOXYD12_FULL_49_8]|uniref:DUF2764 domain-containing protein n=1 Tax=Candidatus Lambdaproteobacteria bacterium RIFOXYD2_FULL_50_16 TaxID=1817772 RepID=A0A1F6GFJ9_9PROT|nr:MAG: hypothetical protein A2527_00370 [Candidatus Lambdaproteobacteria bacterium RIFOXYD2_FULL_50_16]OGG97781.1 MAG: hypothetical protein A2508_06390 [Candidatus Lambdaproteobacteria bacterium RIFOXYD12_FULL_49_8]
MSIPYLLASLPPLQFEEPAPLSQAEFLETCEVLPPGQHAILENILNHQPGDFGVEAYRQYLDFKWGLDHELVLLRARQLGLSELEVLSLEPFPEAPLPQAGDILNAHDPLEAEILRLHMLWERVNLLEPACLLNFSQLVLYTIKLSLIFRKDHFDPERGTQKLSQVLAQLSEGVL